MINQKITWQLNIISFLLSQWKNSSNITEISHFFLRRFNSICSQQRNQVKLNPDKFQFIIFSNCNNTYTDIVFQDVAIPSSSFTLLDIDIKSK